MMINTPSAPGGAAAAQSALPGVAVGGAPALAEGTPAVTTEGGTAGTGLPMPFAQLFDFAGLATTAGIAGTQPAGTPAAQAEDAEPAAEEAPAEAPLAAMMPALHFAVLPQAAPVAAGTMNTSMATVDATQARGATLLAAASGSARQAAADAITNGAAAAATVATTPLAARLLQGALPATAEPVALKADARPGAAGTATAGGTVHSAANAAATVLAAQDGAAQSGQDGQAGQQPQGDGQATFRGVMAASAPLAGATAPADTVKLAGTPEQWQQPLRAALGDRLQVTLQKGNDQAVIRLEPPNLGSIEISIRQTAGALHVSMSATNSEVVRQLNAVGDSMRQDLSQRQQGDVAVTVSQASSRSLADSEGRGRQPEREAEQQREQRGPGRALNEGDVNNTTFAMLRE